MRLQGSLGYLDRLFGQLFTFRGTTMIAIEGPMSIIRGDAAVYRITVTDENDARVDLRDYELELEIKATLDAVDPALVAKVIGDGVTLLDQDDPETEGQADIVITSADSSALTAGIYWLDVVTIDGDGDRQHVIAPLEYVVGGTVNLPPAP